MFNEQEYTAFVDELVKIAAASDVELNSLNKVKGFISSKKQQFSMKRQLHSAHKKWMKDNNTIISLTDFHDKMKAGEIPDALGTSFLKKYKKPLIGAAIAGAAYLALRPKKEEVEQPVI